MIPNLGTHAAALQPGDVAKTHSASNTLGGPKAFAGRPFADLLDGALNKVGEIKFSAHALQRLQERAIELSAEALVSTYH